MIPTPEQCYELMEMYDMLPNIVEHSKLVRRVAVTLARLLQQAQCPLDMALVEAGALLHDITKSRAIVSGENHTATGAELLMQHGYPRVAEVVAQHVNLHPLTLDSACITEAEVVNYADKRVMHDQLVDLEQRFLDILDRYGKSIERVERIKGTEKEVRRVENKIFALLPITPQQLEALIDETS